MIVTNNSFIFYLMRIYNEIRIINDDIIISNIQNIINDLRPSAIFLSNIHSADPEVYNCKFKRPANLPVVFFDIEYFYNMENFIKQAEGADFICATCPENLRYYKFKLNVPVYKMDFYYCPFFDISSNFEADKFDFCYFGGIYDNVWKKELFRIMLELDKYYSIYISTWGRKNDYLDQFKNAEINNKFHTHEEMIRIYRSSRFCLDAFQITDIGMMSSRPTEIMSSKSLYLGIKNKIMSEKFANEKEVLMFDNYNELLRIIDEYRDNRAKRNKIAEAGYKKIKSKTYKDFLNDINIKFNLNLF